MRLSGDNYDLVALRENNGELLRIVTVVTYFFVCRL